MLWSILLAVVIILLIWVVVCDENSVDIVPGPPKKPIIGNVMQFINSNPRSLFILMRQYASLYKDRYLIKIFRRRILHIYNAADVEVVLSHSRNITKSKPYSFLTPWLGTGLLISTGKKWHSRRKILTPTFHFNILRSFAVIIEEKSRAMVDQLKRGPEEVNLYPAVSDFTLYTICETAMGTQLDKDKSASAQEYKSAILEIGNILLSRLTRVWLHNEYIFRQFPIGKHFERILTRVHRFSDNVILERKKQRALEYKDVSAVLEGEVLGSKKRIAMLDLLLEAESKGEIDLEGIREEVNTFMFEGHDTTATAITFGLMLLADHEDIQERIYEEFIRIFGNTDRMPTMADLTEMKYLEAVIKETLRLYPSVPFIAREISEDFVMGDLEIKKGTEVAIHIYDLHRCEDLFPEPETFKPERFLSGGHVNPYAYVPFSAGSRNCIGQRFAMQEMKCILSEICRSFRLQPRTKGWRPDLVTDMVLRSMEPIYVKFIKR